MNQSGFSTMSLIFLLPLLLASLLFMFNINHKLDETLMLTSACDTTIKPALSIIQQSTNQILDLNPSIKILNFLYTTTQASILAATASGNLYLLPALLKTLAQIHKSQKTVKSLQSRLIDSLKLKMFLLQQKVRLQFVNRLKLDSHAKKLLFKTKSTTFNLHFPSSSNLLKKNPNLFLSEMKLAPSYTNLMVGKIEFTTHYQQHSRFQKWFKKLNESKGVCAWTILEKNGRADQLKIREGKY